MPQNIDPYRDYPTVTTFSVNTSFEGTLKFQNSLRINGDFKGKIEATGLLVLGPNSKVSADIICDEVIVGGEVKGNITARKRLELLETAKVYGDIKTPKLKIADGVIFEGKCDMSMANQKS